MRLGEDSTGATVTGVGPRKPDPGGSRLLAEPRSWRGLAAGTEPVSSPRLGLQECVLLVDEPRLVLRL
jgi:hypothetical protein